MAFPFLVPGRLEDRAEASPGAVEEHPHLTGRDLEAVGYMLVRQPFDATEPEDLGLFLGQFGEPMAQAVQEFCGQCVLERASRFAGGLGHAVKRHNSGTEPAA
jgi:hypothetical protein